METYCARRLKLPSDLTRPRPAPTVHGRINRTRSPEGPQHAARTALGALVRTHLHWPPRVSAPAPAGRIFTEIVCHAINSEDRGKGVQRGARMCGHFIGRSNGSLMRATGRIVLRAEDVQYHHGKVFYAARCPKCEMVTEFEILPPPDGWGGSAPVAGPPLPRGASPGRIGAGLRRRLKTAGERAA